MDRNDIIENLTSAYLAAPSGSERRAGVIAAARALGFDGVDIAREALRRESERLVPQLTQAQKIVNTMSRVLDAIPEGKPVGGMQQAQRTIAGMIPRLMEAVEYDRNANEEEVTW